MRVTFVCPTLAVGGAERLLASIVLALREHGVEPTVVALNHAGRFFDELRDAGVDARFAAMSARHDVGGLRRARSMIRAARPDVVVSQSVAAHVVGRWATWRSGIPHVAIEHGGPGLARAAHRRLLTRLVAPHVALVIAVTEAQRPSLVADGYPAERIVVIPNGIPEPRPTRDRGVVRDELGVGDGELLALLVAVLRPEKQATLFVDAVAAARARGFRVRGAVAGSGPDLGRVRERARMSDGVVVLGERHDVADLISAADVVCLTSAAEGLPIVVLEAMALGRPVLSTAVGGVPEALGGAGILVETGSVAAVTDALCAAASDLARLANLGRAARERYVLRFAMERAAERYAQALAGVLVR